MTQLLSGGCACGAIRYSSTGRQRFALKCQCRSCQRNTGSGHAAQIAVSRSGFSVEGDPSIWTRQSDAGFEVSKAFCKTCGCPLYGFPARMPEIVMIMAGSLDDPSQINPDQIVYSEQAQHWDSISPLES